MISARQLTVARPRITLLRDAAFTVPAGACWAVVGRNGSGKSTLLATLAGLLPAPAGEVRVLGSPLPAWRRPELALHLGFLPQHRPVVFPFTVEEFVRFGRLPWRKRDQHGPQAVREAMTAMDLDSIAHRTLTTLSGGEAQRVCIAQVLAQTTEVLLLDEPMAHLDLLHQLRLMRTLRALADRGRAIVVATHDLALAWRYCNQFLVLGPGGMRLVERDNKEAVAAALAWAYDVEFHISEDGPRLAEAV